MKFHIIYCNNDDKYRIGFTSNIDCGIEMSYILMLAKVYMLGNGSLNWPMSGTWVQNEFNTFLEAKEAVDDIIKLKEIERSNNVL